MHTLYQVILIVALLPGFIFVFIPGLPSVGYMFLVTFVFSVFGITGNISLTEHAILFGLAVLSFIVDILSGTLGARYSGASAKSLLIGFVAFTLGSLILSPLGGVICMFIALMTSELYRGRGHFRALISASGGVIGVLLGMFVNLAIVGVFFIVAVVSIIN